MGQLEHFVYAYRTFRGYVNFSYTPPPRLEDVTGNSCAWTGGGFPGNTKR
jgi:hypothetical protein